MEDEDHALLATYAPCHALIALTSEVDRPYLDSSEEIEIFGSTDKRSSFSIKIKHHQFKGTKIPKNYKFNIEFSLSNRCDFDIESFFKLVVILGGFGKSAKNIYKGKIKILKIGNNEYKFNINLENILELLNNSNEKFEMLSDKNEISSKNFKFNYPMIDKIWIENNILNTKLKEDKIFKRLLDG